MEENFWTEWPLLPFLTFSLILNVSLQRWANPALCNLTISTSKNVWFKAQRNLFEMFQTLMSNTLISTYSGVVCNHFTSSLSVCPELFGDLRMEKSIYLKYLKGCVWKPMCWIKPQFHVYRRSMGSIKAEKVIQDLWKSFFNMCPQLSYSPLMMILWKKDVQP